MADAIQSGRSSYIWAAILTLLGLTAGAASPFILGILQPANGGTGINNGTNTLTVPATGTAALLGTANIFTAAQNFSSGNDTGFGFLFGSNNVTGAEYIAQGIIQVTNNCMLKWTSSLNVFGTVDLALYRNAAGILEINNGTAGVFSDLKLRKLSAFPVNGSQNTFGTATTADALADTLIATSATTQKGLVIQGSGAADNSQTANLFEIQGRSGSKYAQIVISGAGEGDLILGTTASGSGPGACVQSDGATFSVFSTRNAGTLYLRNGSTNSFGMTSTLATFHIPLATDNTVASGVAGTSTGQLILANATGANSTIIQAGASAPQMTYTFPTSAPAPNQFLQSTNATGTLAWANGAIVSRASAQYDAVTNTTLANVPGLTGTLTAGRTYSFKATLHLTLDATGGVKLAIGGTCTATAIIYQINMVNNSTNLNTINARQTALGGASAQVSGTTDFAEITGTITVNAAGTLTAQMAQSAAVGTSSVLVGSTFIIQDIP